MVAPTAEQHVRVEVVDEVGTTPQCYFAFVINNSFGLQDPREMKAAALLQPRMRLAKPLVVFIASSAMLVTLTRTDKIGEIIFNLLVHFRAVRQLRQPSAGVTIAKFRLVWLCHRQTHNHWMVSVVTIVTGLILHDIFGDSNVCILKTYRNKEVTIPV